MTEYFLETVEIPFSCFFLGGNSMFIPALSTQQDAPQKGKETVELQRALVSLARTAGNSIWRMFFVGFPMIVKHELFLTWAENPVVRRELRSYGYSYSLLNGELRSYQEFPNHILDNQIAISGNSLSKGDEELLFSNIDDHSCQVAVDKINSAVRTNFWPISIHSLDFQIPSEKGFEAHMQLGHRPLSSWDAHPSHMLFAYWRWNTQSSWFTLKIKWQLTP